MEGQLIAFESLPSRGIAYPKDIEIYVRPLTIKEQMDMDRYGISQAEYYQILLNGITVRGDFNKNDLLFYDVHFMDLMRRLFTFDPEEEISISGVKCSNPYCNKDVKVKFLTASLGCNDFKEDIFNKEFEFTDGTTVVISPITIKDFISMSKKYITNKAGTITDTLLAYFAYCTVEIKDRTFKTEDMMRDYLIEFYGGLYKNKDTKVLRKIEEETVCTIKPVKVVCPFCGENMEVEVAPSMTFQQEDEDI